MKKLDAAAKKIAKVMGEYKRGTLHAAPLALSRSGLSGHGLAPESLLAAPCAA